MYEGFSVLNCFAVLILCHANIGTFKAGPLYTVAHCPYINFSLLRFSHFLWCLCPSRAVKLKLYLFVKLTFIW